jgi:glutamate synthase domain-containing protein 1
VAVRPDFKIPSACGTAGIIDTTGRRFDGSTVLNMMACMFERGNGLGAGYAAYGIYPDHADSYAFHLMCESEAALEAADAYVRQYYEVEHREPIPTRPVASIVTSPILWRYFVQPSASAMARFFGYSEEDFVVATVMELNRSVTDALIISSGKNMGVFKGVGYPEEIGPFFRIDEYEGYCWIAHSRFPTNTTGWWGGAHPFALLDWAIVHNGEISSYGINKQFLHNFGYECAFQTDSEVINYLWDLLVRKHGLSIELASMAMAPPFWGDVERLSPTARQLVKAMRMTYAGALLNGPFSIIVGFEGGMLGLTDRIKLRPMVAASAGDIFYLASEEAAIRTVSPQLDSCRPLEAGKPVVAALKEGAKWH